MGERITADFFQKHPVDCARDLIGAHFIWDGCAGRVVETEAYADEGDLACHAAFRPSARTFITSHPAGTAYVYLNYGVHWLFNVLVKGPGGAGFVLLRALEPESGLDLMASRRGEVPPRHWCSGPGKLTAALGIDGRAHGREFLGDSGRGFAAGERTGVAESLRIGIRRSMELPWRFTEAGNRFLSRGG